MSFPLEDSSDSVIALADALGIYPDCGCPVGDCRCEGPMTSTCIEAVAPCDCPLCAPADIVSIEAVEIRSFKRSASGRGR